MIALLVACQTPEVQVEPPVDPPSDAPWVLPATTSTGADLAAVAASAQDAIARVVEIDPDPVLDAYRALYAGADAGCPALYRDDDVEYWLDTCTSGAGTVFDGFGLDETLTIDDGAGVYDVTATGGAGRIEAADGTFVEVDGYVQRIDQSDGTVVVSSLVLSGDFSTNVPGTDGTWLGEGIRPNLAVTRYSIGGQLILFGVEGALDQLPGENPAVAFHDAVILDPDLGYGGCGDEPSGTMSVRLPSGEWVDIDFDPVVNDDGLVEIDDPAACDGCGAGWHRAESLGPICLDFAAWR
ncbi:MAG: hypothetical protein ABMA64_07700 [Myxococcota bacterium]